MLGAGRKSIIGRTAPRWSHGIPVFTGDQRAGRFDGADSGIGVDLN